MRVSDSLELSFRQEWAVLWVLGVEPGPSGKPLNYFSQDIFSSHIYLQMPPETHSSSLSSSSFFFFIIFILSNIHHSELEDVLLKPVSYGAIFLMSSY